MGEADASAQPGQTIGYTTPTVEVDVALSLDAALRLGDVLGEGGMAVVREGEQRSLRRKVAVKSSRHTRPEQQARLVAEAHITGALEHPHIVPVHDIVRDADDRLHIVLKRIDGVPWSAVLREPERHRDRFGDEEPREWHLDVLQAVCRALQFAHARGVIHRDIKPDNVMVGAFGEVYVVDWGVAASLDALAGEDGGPRRAVGTPRYMAPELAAGDTTRMSVRTDVYLLGAVLHEIVTGHPPHRGFDVPTMLRQVPEFRPRVDGDVALQRLLERAMAASPDERFESVEAFHQALRRYRRERSARELLAQASGAVERLRGALTAEQADRMVIYQLYGAARFGLEEVHRATEAPEAAARLRSAAILVARWELEQGEDRAALAVLASIPDPPGELVADAEALAAERAARARRLDALEREANPWIGKRARARLVVAMLAVWIVAPLINAVLPTRMLISVLLLAGAIAGAYVFRSVLFATQRNRVTVALLVAIITGNLVNNLAPMLGLLQASSALANAQLLNALMALVASMLLDRRYALLVVLYGAAFVTSDVLLAYRPLVGSGLAAVVAAVTLRVFDIRGDDVLGARA